MRAHSLRKAWSALFYIKRFNKNIMTIWSCDIHLVWLKSAGKLDLRYVCSVMVSSVVHGDPKENIPCSICWVCFIHSYLLRLSCTTIAYFEKFGVIIWKLRFWQNSRYFCKFFAVWIEPSWKSPRWHFSWSLLANQISPIIIQ